MGGSLAALQVYVPNRLFVLKEWAQAATEKIAKLKSVNARLGPVPCAARNQAGPNSFRSACTCSSSGGSDVCTTFQTVLTFTVA